MDVDLSKLINKAKPAEDTAPYVPDMTFADLAIELCDGCPSHIEDDKTYWIETVGQYCPWSARVTAVDDRRGAS